MQISLRSQMIAGVAAVGATAMAITPIAQPEVLTSVQRVSSAVELAAFANPVEVLLATLADTSASIFDQAALLDPADLFWPDSFYTPDFSFVFAPGYYGLIPDFANQVSFGGLSAVVTNLSGYVYATTEGLAGLVGGPVTAVSNIPFALVTAAGYLAAGQPELALAELQTQILGPLQQGIGTALAAAGYIIDNVIANATTLLSNAIPGLVGNLINTVTNGAVYVGQSLINTLSTAITQLTAGQFEDAWNTAVEGLLGPFGTLGQLKDLTIGIGITEFVDYEQEGEVLTVVVPSLRSDLTTMSQRLGDLSQYGDGGIRNDAFELPVTVTPPAAALSAPEAAAVEVARPVAGSADASEAAAVTAADVAATESDDAAADSDVQAADASAPSTVAGSDGSARGGSSDNSGQAKAKASRGSARGAAS